MDTYGAITVRRSVMASEIFLCARKQCYDAVAKEPSLRFSQEIDLLAGWLNEKGEILKHLSKGLHGTKVVAVCNFQSLSPDELRSLAAVVRLKEYKADTVICEQGETTDRHVYFHTCIIFSADVYN